MTDTKTVLGKFEQTLAHYERELERYDLEQLTRKPGEEEWSLGQMYMHLIRSALILHLANVEACRTDAMAEGGLASVAPSQGEHGRAAISAGYAPSPDAAAVAAVTEVTPVPVSAAAGAGKTERGIAAFASGSFPPIAVRVPPSPQYTPPQPESKDEIAQGLRQVLARMREAEPVLASIPDGPTRPHPAFGALNATEWFCLVEMHYRHHLRQKERLDAFLGV